MCLWCGVHVYGVCDAVCDVCAICVRCVYGL